MFKRIFLFISILFLISFFAGIQVESTDLEIKSSVDKNKLELGEAFNYKIDIVGDIRKFPDVKLPDFKKNFNVLSSGQSQGISLEGEESHLAMSYEFVLQPKEAGKFTIEEAEIKFKGRVYKTQSVNIEVIENVKPKSLPDKLKNKPHQSEGIFI